MTCAGMTPVSRKRSRDHPSGRRLMPGIIEEARQALTDDSFGVRHDAVDQFLYRRDVVDEARNHAATPRASVHIAVDHHLGIDARHLIVSILDLDLLCLTPASGVVSQMSGLVDRPATTSRRRDESPVQTSRRFWAADKAASRTPRLTMAASRDRDHPVRSGQAPRFAVAAPIRCRHRSR
jgi:hypothetical protein